MLAHRAYYDTPDGTGVRDYIHVSDLAAAHVVALDALVADPARSFTYNCGYGHGYSVLEVLDAVDAVVGTPIRRAMGPRRAGDPAMLVADSSALQRDLGWKLGARRPARHRAGCARMGKTGGGAARLSGLTGGRRLGSPLSTTGEFEWRGRR